MTSLRLLAAGACLAAVVAISAIAVNKSAGDPQPADGTSRSSVAKNTLKRELQRDAAQRPFGIAQRVPWTTSNFRGSPEPPLPFRAERVFPHISFKNPTVLTNAPGTDRFFVAEQLGKVYSIANDPDCKAPDVFVDPAELVARLNEKGLDPLDFEATYGMTFHPQFAQNRYCYLCYVVRYRDVKRGQHPDGTRVVRLTVSDTDPPRCDPASELTIITWLQGGHNGGCLKFGKDGRLYISSGDGAGPAPPDILNAGQDVTNLLSDIMRIDVDHPPPGKAYAIPADNPFVDLPGARGEIWAFGLRNPWKMSFDRQTGDLWIGDVGWELWELVYRARKGDNFGWSLVEGPQSVYPERQRGPTPIVPPTLEIPHTEGASVTGGFVYRGRKFPELFGQYIFGDWETRRIWGVPVDGETIGPRRDVMEPSVRVVDFSEDNDGELYLLDYDAGTIHSMVRNPAPPNPHVFPRRLSETGLFASVAAHRPAPGVVPFSVNAAQWNDGASAERWLAVPGEGSMRLHTAPVAIPNSMFTRLMDYPVDTVLTKTLSVEMERGNPASQRRVETQAIHFDGRDWRGYTFEWNDDQTDAVLVEADGKSRVLSIADSQAPGGRRQQTWRFASRTECLRCHNPWAEGALAFNVAQLNRDHDYGGVVDNQLRTLQHAGLLLLEDGAPSIAGSLAPVRQKSPEELPRLPSPFDESADLLQRGRAYLHANCAHCHRFNGGGSAYVLLGYELPLAEMKAMGVRPSQGTFGIHDAKIIAPGDPYRSVLFFRMAKLGPGHMPYIGTSIVDARGLELIHEWIRRLPARPDDAAAFDRLAALDAAAGAASEPPNEMPRIIDELLATPSRAAMLARALHQGRLAGPVRAAAVAAAAQHADPSIRDLFESFLPEEQRVRRLGDTVRPAEILNLTGEIERGKELFHKTEGIQCRNCHKISGEGTEIGPDLSQIGKKHTRAKLLESILEPSKNIDPQFVTWVVETTAGKVLSGILVRKTAQEMVLRDAQNKEHVILIADIENSAPLQKSLMPDLLVRDFTAQQLADLLAYLESLK